MKAGQTIYSEAVQARTLQLAEQAGSKAWQETLPRLEGLEDIFDPSLLEQVEARVRARVSEELAARRELAWNDHHSSQPGIVLFISRAGLAKLRDTVRRGFGSPRHLEAFTSVDADGKLFAVHLPRAGYYHDNGGLDSSRL